MGKKKDANAWRTEDVWEIVRHCPAYRVAYTKFIRAAEAADDYESLVISRLINTGATVPFDKDAFEEALDWVARAKAEASRKPPPKKLIDDVKDAITEIIHLGLSGVRDFGNPYSGDSLELDLRRPHCRRFAKKYGDVFLFPVNPHLPFSNAETYMVKQSVRFVTPLMGYYLAKTLWSREPNTSAMLSMAVKVGAIGDGKATRQLDKEWGVVGNLSTREQQKFMESRKEQVQKASEALLNDLKKKHDISIDELALNFPEWNMTVFSVIVNYNYTENELRASFQNAMDRWLDLHRHHKAALRSSGRRWADFSTNIEVFIRDMLNEDPPHKTLKWLEGTEVGKAKLKGKKGPARQNVIRDAVRSVAPFFIYFSR
jgi:hypothetical protein